MDKEFGTEFVLSWFILRRATLLKPARLAHIRILPIGVVMSFIVSKLFSPQQIVG